jgi:hypothetical protein
MAKGNILEEVRAKEFPALPSRFDCLFVIDDIDEAKYYRDLKATASVFYSVTLLDPAATTHVADWKGTGPYDDTKEWARRYWRGDVMPHPETAFLLRERLTLSRIQIDETV